MRPRRLRPLQADGVRLRALPPPVDVRTDHRAPRTPGLRLTRSTTARRKGLARSASQRQTGQTVRLAGSLDCFDWSAIGARGMRVVAVFVRYCLRSRWAGASHREIAGMRPGWFRSLVAGVAVGAFCAWWLVAPSPAGSDPAVSEALMTFGFTGAAQTYLVPEDVCAVTVTAAGANGGSAEAAGGTGGQIEATFAVSPHESLTIVVGGHGTTMNTGTTGGAGGFGRGSGGAGGSGGAHGARVAAARPRLRPSADGRCWWQAVAAVPERLSARGVTGAPAAPRAPTDPLPRLSGRVVPARGAPRLRLARAARVAGEAPPRGVPRTRSTVARAAPVIPRVPRVVVAAAAGVGASVALGAGVRPPMRAAEVAVAVRGSSIRARPQSAPVRSPRTAQVTDRCRSPARKSSVRSN